MYEAYSELINASHIYLTLPSLLRLSLSHQYSKELNRKIFIECVYVCFCFKNFMSCVILVQNFSMILLIFFFFFFPFALKSASLLSPLDKGFSFTLLKTPSFIFNFASALTLSNFTMSTFVCSN